MQMKDMVLLHTITDLDGEDHITGSYGPELLLDCSECDPTTFTRKSIKGYMKALCKAIDMQREDLHFWDDKDVPGDEKRTEPHVVGISAVQFIITSSIVIHTLTKLERVYVDIFSCKLFDEGAAKSLTWNWFKAGRVGSHLIQRS